MSSSNHTSPIIITSEFLMDMVDRSDPLHLSIPGATPCSSSSQSCLSVPGVLLGPCSGPGGSNSQEQPRRSVSSTASSIFDLSSEADRLEMSIRDNDLQSLSKILSFHVGKFSLVSFDACGGRLGWDNWSYVDSISNRSYRSHSYSTVSVGRQSIYSLQPVDYNHTGGGLIRGRKYSHTQPLQSGPPDLGFLSPTAQHSGTTWDGVPLLTTASSESRRESSCTENADTPTPWIFKNALHVAIQNNAIESLMLLLRSGVDANRHGTSPVGEQRLTVPLVDGPGSSGARNKDVRFRLHTDDGGGSNSATSSGVSNVSEPVGEAGGGAECGIRRSRSMPRSKRSLPKRRQPPVEGGQILHAGSSHFHRCGTPVIRLETDDEPPNTDTVLLDCDNNVSDLDSNNQTKNLNYVTEFTGDYLYCLPPLFLAVSLRNDAAVRVLLTFGASPTALDTLHACTPLHLSSSEAFYSRACSLALIEYGAPLSQKNTYGVAPIDLDPGLEAHQTKLVNDSIDALNTFLHIEANATTGGPEAKKQAFTEYSKVIGARLFRRSRRRRREESGSGTARVTGMGKSLDSERMYTKRRESLASKDSLVEGSGSNQGSLEAMAGKKTGRERSESNSSFRSRVSFNFRVANSSPQPPSLGEESTAELVNTDIMCNHHTSPVTTVRDKEMNTGVKPTKSQGITRADLFKSQRPQHHKTPAEDLEKSILVLIRLASNWECVPLLIEGLAGCVSPILASSEHPENHNLERLISNLLNQITSTCQLTLESDGGSKRSSVLLQLNKLLKICLQLLHLSNYGAKFTALCIINRVIDISIWQRTCEALTRNSPHNTEETLVNKEDSQTGLDIKLESVTQHACKSSDNSLSARLCDKLTGLSGRRLLAHSSAGPAGSSPSVARCDSLERAARAGLERVAQTTLRLDQPSPRPRAPSWKRPSSFRHRDSQRSLNTSSLVIAPDEPSRGGSCGGPGEASTPTDQPDNTAFPRETSAGNLLEADAERSGTAFDVLSSQEPDIVLGILRDSISNHKQLMGQRHRCTPSVRWRQCTHHCLQVLSARLFTVMCHGATVQRRVVDGGHIKMLVDFLDPNHDPQLLCLVLQALACIAMNPSYHDQLIEADMPDTLMQLLLPSDEWYYTNQSTKYARYVKYHAARILVYMGLFQRLGGRVDLFDMKPFEQTTQGGMHENVEDAYIDQMAMGQLLCRDERGNIMAGSLEGLILELIQDVERDLQSGGHTGLPSAASVSLHRARDGTQGNTAVCDDRSGRAGSQGSSPASSSFHEYFFSALPIIVHPIIVLRLLCHKMFGNMLRRKTAPQPTSPDRNSLTPPPISALTESCPPVWPTTPGDYNPPGPGFHSIAAWDDRIRSSVPSPMTAGSRRRHDTQRKTNVHVHITTPTKSRVEERDEEFRLHRARTRRAGSMDKHLLRIGSAKRRSINAAMSFAIKTIGDSLIQPVDGSVSSPISSHVEAYLSSNEARKSKAFFRFTSLRKRSRSQGYISKLDDSSDSLLCSHVSSTQSITKPDAEIKDFQKELINLPIFEVDTHPKCTETPPMSRFSSVPDQLEFVHVNDIMNTRNGQHLSAANSAYQKCPPVTVITKSGPRTLRQSSADQKDTLVDLHYRNESYAEESPSREMKIIEEPKETPNTNSAAVVPQQAVVLRNGSRKRRQYAGSSQASRWIKDSTSSSLLSSDCPLTSGSMSSAGRSTILSPLQTDTIVFHFAAATPCESPISNANVFLENNPTITSPFDDSLCNHLFNLDASCDDTESCCTVVTPSIAVSAPLKSGSGSSQASTPIYRPQSLWSTRTGQGELGKDQLAISPAWSGESDMRSPNCSLVLPSPGIDISIQHRCVMLIIENWIGFCSIDFECSSAMQKETKEFFNKMSSLGPEYKQWSVRLREKLRLEEPILARTESEASNDVESIQALYKKFYQQISSGELGCSKEEAATLAGIKLHLDEAWPEETVEFDGGDDPPANAEEGERGHLLQLYDLAAPFTGGPRGADQRTRHRFLTFRRRFLLSISRTGKNAKKGRRRGRLTQSFRCVDGENGMRSCFSLPDASMARCLPPEYRSSRSIRELIEEKQTKLWHTPFYDSEVKLKQLYVKICRNLPAHNSKLFEVKEIIRTSNNSVRKESRLLGIGPERLVLIHSKTKVMLKSQQASDLRDWTGSGRGGLTLEFRGSKTWTLVCSSEENLKAIRTVLWNISSANRPIGFLSFQEDVLEFELSRQFLFNCKTDQISTVLTEELLQLDKLLQFPEEVALQLTDIEHQLFTKVRPVDYVRQITMDMGKRSQGSTSNKQSVPPCGVSSLIQHFHQVASWTTNVMVSQSSQEARKTSLCCLIRVLQTCCNIGNFNSAVEILSGLKSEKLKSFWLTVSEREVRALQSLSDSLISRGSVQDYRDAVLRALRIPDCKVVPFFGTFLQDLYSILSAVPGVVVFASDYGNALETISDFNGEDRFMTRIGVGGLLNLHKVHQTHTLLHDIQKFHRHKNTIGSSGSVIGTDAFNNLAAMSGTEITFPAIEGVTSDDFSDFDTGGAPGRYKPIRPIGDRHGVSVLGTGSSRVSPHDLQCMHHGTAVLRWDTVTGHFAPVFLRLENDSCLLSWTRPPWAPPRSLPSAAAPAPSSSTLQDCLVVDENSRLISSALSARYQGGAGSAVLYRVDDFEDGFIDLMTVKDFTVGCGPAVDLSSDAKLYPAQRVARAKNCFTLLFGTTITDNKTVEFVMPVRVAGLWRRGLGRLVRAAHNHRKRCSDRRLHWLKDQYLLLYFDGGRCQGPSAAEAVKLFGGRKLNSESSSPGTVDSHHFPHPAGASSVSANGRLKNKSNLQPRLSTDGSKLSLLQQESKQSLITPDIPLVRSRSKSRLSSTDVSKRTELHSSSWADFRSSNIPPSSSFRALVNPPSNLTFNFEDDLQRKRRSFTRSTSALLDIPVEPATILSFPEFVHLFKTFSVRVRKDLKDLFDQLIHEQESCDKRGDSSMRSRDTNKAPSVEPADGYITRNSMRELSDPSPRQNSIDSIVTSSFQPNPDRSVCDMRQCLSLNTFKQFLQDYQELENISNDDVLDIIQRHERCGEARRGGELTLDGFARYMMDKDNLVIDTESLTPNDEEMSHPLSHYYIDSSHNTYLTGHQLRGESSVELYTQVLLMGCRCVELDCWDGDDGFPIIYHGYTLTTKIPFRNVVEAINKSAFVVSPYPVMLSIENRCSLPQQEKMAQIFTEVFGDKLIQKDLLENIDMNDDALLPSPNQLKYKILIKNKKIRSVPLPVPGLHLKHRLSNQSARMNQYGMDHGLQDDDDDDEDDEDDDFMIEEGRPVDEIHRCSNASSNVKTNLEHYAKRLSSADSHSSQQSKGSLSPRSRTKSLGELQQKLAQEQEASSRTRQYSGSAGNLALSVGGLNGDCQHDLYQSASLELLSTDKSSRKLSLQVTDDTTVDGTSCDSQSEAGASKLRSNNMRLSKLDKNSVWRIAMLGSGSTRSNSEGGGTAGSPGVEEFSGRAMDRDLARVRGEVKPNSNRGGRAQGAVTQESRDSSRSISYEENNPSGPDNKIRPKSDASAGVDWQTSSDRELEQTPKNIKKKKTDVAQALSDLVIYTQAVKFRGLIITPPVSRQRRNMNRRNVLHATNVTSHSASIDVGDQFILLTNPAMRGKQEESDMPSAYQISSLNENKAKHVCRKQPIGVINHCEAHIIRTYPAGMRIDSSNFNPIPLWACGIQMIALNYQTEDSWLHINTAMFEQNGRCGYVLKPRVLWDRSHPLYNRLNPFDKEIYAFQPATLHVSLISGQYVCQTNHTASPQVEIQLWGIPADCSKHKSKVISRNSVNPIWNEVYMFQVLFSDFAFLRLAVVDAATNHTTAQRVIPLKGMKPGFRHISLRSVTNQPLEVSSLFIYSRLEESPQSEGSLCSQPEPDRPDGRKTARGVLATKREAAETTKLDKEILYGMNMKPRRKHFFIHVLLNISLNEDYVILKVTQDTKTFEAIQQVLIKTGRSEEKVEGYMLVVETQKGWDHRDSGAVVQRVLDLEEKVVLSQSKWRGSGRFILRKNSNIKREGSLMIDVGAEWDSEMFLVCIHNVSPEQPYTMLQAPTSSCASDIVSQAMSKVRRPQDADNFVLCEEIILSSSLDREKSESRHISRRILSDDENVLLAQRNWKNNCGKFILVERQKAFEERSRKDVQSFLRRLSIRGITSFTRDKKDQPRRHGREDSDSRGHRFNYKAQKIWEWQNRNQRARRDSPGEASTPPGERRDDEISNTSNERLNLANRTKKHLFKPR